MKAVVVAPGEGRFVAIGSAGAGVMVKASETDTGELVLRIGEERQTARAGTSPLSRVERSTAFTTRAVPARPCWLCTIPPASSAISRKCSNWLLGTEAERNRPSLLLALT